MTLVRWDPFRELEDMSDRLNRVFARPAARTSGGKEQLTVADWVPTVDISENDGEYLIKAELPEVKKEDVKVTVEDGVLTLQGARHQEKEEKGKWEAGGKKEAGESKAKSEEKEEGKNEATEEEKV